MSLTLVQRDAFRRAFADEKTFATTLLTILLDVYGAESLTWSPETVLMELQEDLGVSLPKFLMDRLFAAAGIVTSDDFYKRLSVFNQYCRILSGGDFDPQHVVPAGPSECAWGITEGVLLSPPEDEEPFTEEIRAFLGKVLDEAGITDAPDVLRIALRDSGWEPDYSAFSLNDPAMFGAEWQNQAQRGQDVEVMLKEMLANLVQQVSALPLTNGDVRDLVQRAAAAIHAED